MPGGHSSRWASQWGLPSGTWGADVLQRLTSGPLSPATFFGVLISGTDMQSTACATGPLPAILIWLDMWVRSALLHADKLTLNPPDFNFRWQPRATCNRILCLPT